MQRESTDWLEALDEKISVDLDLLMSLPWNLKEAILLLLYLKPLSVTQLMKTLFISHVKFHIPYKMNPSIWHFGPSDRLLSKYIRLVIEEGYVAVDKVIGQEGQDKRVYELTEKGSEYVKTVILPWDDLDKFKSNLLLMLSFPTEWLTEYASYVAGFRKDSRQGNVAVRISYMDDFMTPHYTRIGSKIALNTLLFQYLSVKEFSKGVFGIPKFSASDLPEIKRVNCNLHKVLIKNKIPHSDMLLFELKNCVLNRFLYILATYIVNILDERWATSKEIKFITHDQYFEATYKRPFGKYLPNEEVDRLRTQAKMSLRNVSRDLEILVKLGFLEADNDKKCYQVTALSFNDGSVTLHLPKPEWLTESYHILRDEIVFLNHRTEGLKRGFHGI